MIRAAEWSEAVSGGYIAGETIASIAKRLGPSRTTIQREIARQGLARRVGPAVHDQTVTIPTETTALAYAAGLFDGEGNLYWRRRTGRANSARLAIYSTTPEAMDWLQTTFGGFVRWSSSGVGTRRTKPIGIWEVSRQRDAIAILTALLPYLIIKKGKAVEVLADLTRWH